MEVKIENNKFTTYQVYVRSKQRVKKNRELGDLTEAKVFDTLIDHYENKTATSGSDIPSFLFGSTVANDVLFAYLKLHPEAAEFLYGKYQDNRPFMKEVCNNTKAGNPLYIKEVAENLSPYFQYEDIKQEHSRLKSERLRLQDDVSAFKEERTTLEKESNDLSKALESTKKELEELQKSVINIREDRGYKMIMEFIHSVSATMESIISKPEVTEMILGTRTIDKEKVKSIASILKASGELESYLKTEDFLSGSKLDETKEELRKARESLEESIFEVKEEQKLVLDKKVSSLIDKAGKLTARIEGTVGGDLRTPFRNLSDDYYALSSVISTLLIKKGIEENKEKPEINAPVVDSIDLFRKMNDEREVQKKGVFHKN